MIINGYGLGDVPQGLQFVIVDVLPLALGKAVEEERPILRSIGRDHAKPARSPLPWSRDTLLDEATTQIGADKPTLGSFDRLLQTRVTDSRTSSARHHPITLRTIAHGRISATRLSGDAPAAARHRGSTRFAPRARTRSRPAGDDPHGWTENR